MNSLFDSIPPYKRVLYTLSISILPIIVAILYTNSQIIDAQEQLQEMEKTVSKIHLKISQQKQNQQIIHLYANKDPLFLHKQLNSLEFLQNEIVTLKEQINSSCTPDDIFLQKRLQSILQATNKCTFLETSSETGPFYKQSIESQNKPIEIDNTDLEKILYTIEADDPSAKEKPHLLILDGQLDRKKGIFQDFWQCHLKILRREYFP